MSLGEKIVDLETLVPQNYAQREVLMGELYALQETVSYYAPERVPEAMYKLGRLLEYYLGEPDCFWKQEIARYLAGCKIPSTLRDQCLDKIARDEPTSPESRLPSELLASIQAIRKDFNPKIED